MCIARLADGQLAFMNAVPSVGTIKVGRFYVKDDLPTEDDKALQRRLEDHTGE